MTERMAAPFDRRPIRLLLVEDDPLDADLFVRRLGRSLYRDTIAFAVTHVRSLREALERLDAPGEAFHVIVLDLALPDSRGIETLHAVCARRRDAAVAVVSGNQDPRLAQRALAEGADEYLTKSMDDASQIVLMLFNAITRNELRLRERTLRTQLDQEQRQKLGLIDASANAIVATDAAGRIRECNRATQRLFGRDRGELVGAALPELLVHSDERGPLRERFFGAGATAADGDILETAFVTAQGARVPVELTASRGESDAGWTWVFIIRDIRRRIEHRERRRRAGDIQQTVAAMSALVFDPLPQKALLQRLLELLTEVEWLSEPRAGMIYLVEGDAQKATLAAARNTPAGLFNDRHGRGLFARLARERTPRVVHRPRCRHPEAWVPAHGSYNIAIVTPEAEPLGLLSVWVAPDQESDPDREVLVESAGRVLGQVLTHRRHVERMQRLSRIVEQSPTSVVVTDREGRIRYTNPMVEKTSGYSRDELLGQTPRVFKSGLMPPALYAGLWQRITGGKSWSGELVNRRKNGALYFEYATIFPMTDDAGEITTFVAVKEDITAKRETARELEHLATHDALTSLPNRGLLGERLGQSLAYAHRYGRLVVVLVLDIRGFGALNDTHGTAVGDRLLQAVATRLLHDVRRYDTVARLGNDEFAVVLSDVEHEQGIADVAEKLLQLIETPFDIDGRKLRISASVGVAASPRDGETADELLRHAGMALGRARESAVAQYFVYGEQIGHELSMNYALQSALRDALELGQFELHYQPQIDLASGRLAGAEALLRWHHPEHGAISPYRFIPLAEKSGLIVSIGRWVIETACHQFAAWRREHGAGVPLSVNVSSHQFLDPEFPGLVEAALRDSGLPFEMLVLELTESLFLENPREASEVLGRLKELGVRLAIDDFGTGYSSLSYLRRLPIDQLKIDREFVKDISTDPNDAMICHTIIGMAHNLGMEVVAEGAETTDHVSFLKTYDCDLVQGYFFSRPVPGTRFAPLIRRTNWMKPG